MLDPDRQVALQQLPAQARPAFKALWELDLALADVVATSTDPRLGSIRLAWWRDRLADLDSDLPIANEPRIEAVWQHAMKFTNGCILADLPDAWVPLLNPFPWSEEAAEGLRERGKILFGIGSCILDEWSGEAETAGMAWSLVDAAHHCSDRESREFLLGEALGVQLPMRIPRELRALTALAAVARSDALGRGQAARVAAAFWHRLTGQFPR